MTPPTLINRRQVFAVPNKAKGKTVIRDNFGEA